METEANNPIKGLPCFEIVHDSHLYYAVFSGIDRDLIVTSNDEKIILLTKKGLDSIKGIVMEILPIEDVSFHINEDILVDRIVSQSEDEEALIITALNMYFDGIKNSNFWDDKTRKKALYAFADHVTFHREYRRSFFKNDLSAIQRTQTFVRELVHHFWANTIIYDLETSHINAETVVIRLIDLKNHY